MVYFGRVRNGKVEFEQPARLPEGTTVRIEAVPATPQPDANGSDPADGLGLEAVDMGHDDLAAQHDHYIYGTPKRKA